MEAKRDGSFEMIFENPPSTPAGTKINSQTNNKNGKNELQSALYPVIVICRFFGFLPIKILKDGHGMAFRWLSFPLLHFLIMAIYSLYLSTSNFSYQNQLPALLLGAGPTESESSSDEGQGQGQNQNQTDSIGNDMDDDGFFPDLEFIGFQIIKIILNIIHSFVFASLFFVGLFTARKFPLYYKTLSNCFYDIIDDPGRLNEIIALIKIYTVKSIGFYGLLMIVNLAFVTMDCLETMGRLQYHPLMYSGYFLWQFWYASHVLVCIFSTLLVIVLKLTIRVFNERIQKLFGVKRQKQTYGVIFDVLSWEEKKKLYKQQQQQQQQEVGVKDLPLNSSSKKSLGDHRGPEMMGDSKWKLKQKCRSSSKYFDGHGTDIDNYFGLLDMNMPKNFHQNAYSTFSDDSEEDLVDKKERFYEEFRHLKLSYILIEELINPPGFFVSSFVFMEFLIAVLHFVRILIIPFSGALVSSLFILFQAFLHSFFVFRLLLNATELSNEGRETLKILMSVPLKDVPLESQPEVLVLIYKLLSQPVPTICIWGVKLNQLLINGLKRAGLLLLNLGLLIGYVFYATITMISDTKSFLSDGGGSRSLVGVDSNQTGAGGTVRSGGGGNGKTDVDFVLSLMDRSDLIRQFFTKV